MCSRATSKDSRNATSSPALAAGAMPYASLAGQMTLPFGPDHVHASPSAPPESEREPTTNGTCGPSSDGSSPSADLQSRLESRLRARMGATGSPEFVLTWKAWDMPSGPPICALRARARRTSDSDFSGWPTPTSLSFNESHQPGNNRSMNKTQELAGWISPRASEIGRQRTPEAIARAQENGGSAALEDQVHLASWSTPTAHDGTHGARNDKSAEKRGSRCLQREAKFATGPISPSSLAPTANRGVLNPAHSRWLQGYPEIWDSCSPNFAHWNLIQKLLAGLLQA